MGFFSKVSLLGEEQHHSLLPEHITFLTPSADKTMLKAFYTLKLIGSTLEINI